MVQINKYSRVRKINTRIIQIFTQLKLFVGPKLKQSYKIVIVLQQKRLMYFGLFTKAKFQWRVSLRRSLMAFLKPYRNHFFTHVQITVIQCLLQQINTVSVLKGPHSFFLASLMQNQLVKKKILPFRSTLLQEKQRYHRSKMDQYRYVQDSKKKVMDKVKKKLQIPDLVNEQGEKLQYENKYQCLLQLFFPEPAGKISSHLKISQTF
eukprot:TRINITY_DN1667_c1_g1_i1.p2 TRINITY_DN1667_c1_g1~~TRINITY_DN1667_c1_g1_i1.p2  ORF type:complete len:207 (+),score=-13.55 TRINITY_DN1667_c1_g1_i1:429-1049(+)